MSPVEMLQLFTSSNYPAITLTASHLVFTSNTTKYSGDLVPGDTLLQWDGVKMVELEISMIKTSKEAGYWAPLTRAGTLLVNNLLVSCYASYPHTVSASTAIPPANSRIRIIPIRPANYQIIQRSFLFKKIESL